MLILLGIAIRVTVDLACVDPCFDFDVEIMFHGRECSLHYEHSKHMRGPDISHQVGGAITECGIL
jgi:hypothetical protein